MAEGLPQNKKEERLKEAGKKQLRWFEKRLFRFILLPIIILVLVAVGYFCYLFFTNENFNWLVKTSIQAQRLQRAMEQYEKQLKEDQYGGKTPEEAIQLFVDALKKGDLELASKYIVLENQEKYLKEMKDVQTRGMLPLMIRDFEKNRTCSRFSDSSFTCTIANEKDEAILFISLIQPLNSLWKIESY